MKILYLANVRLPSQKAESLQIMKMCEALARAGHHVELVVPHRHNPQLKNEDPYEFYHVENIFKIRWLPMVDFMQWRRLLGSVAFKLNYWIFARVVSIYARLIMTDVIYSRDWRTLQLLRRHKKNLIFELHEYREKDAWAYKSIEAACKRIIVISKGLKRKLVESGIVQEKVFVAPDAVTLEEFDFTLTPPKAREAINLPADVPLVVYTGGLYEWKGIYTIIDGFALFKQRHHDARLILVGGMEEDVSRIKEYIMEHEISGIMLMGHRPYTELPLYMKAADVLILGDSAKFDIGREYTSPLKLFQYMAARRVIVASGTPAIQEVISQESAWLFTPDNPESLAFVLTNAFENSVESQKKVQQAFNLVKQFTWNQRALDIIKSL